MNTVCFHCGQPIRSGARFCGKCGQAQSPPQVVSQPAMHSSPVSGIPQSQLSQPIVPSPMGGAGQTRRSRMLPIAAIGLVLYVLGALAAVLLGQRVAANAVPASIIPKDLPVMPREAGQKGLDWLLSSAVQWQNNNSCYGCHVQSFAVMGAAAAHANDYAVDIQQTQKLADYLASIQSSQGHISAGRGSDVGVVVQTVLAGIGISQYDQVVDDKYADTLVKMADWLVGTQQNSGYWPLDHNEPPVDQGESMTTAGALMTLAAAQRHQPSAGYVAAMEKGASWLRTVDPETTQDALFVIFGLSSTGIESADKDIQRNLKWLRDQQNSDGGWGETPRLASNAYGTGQALYAYKLAALEITDKSFVDGALWLLQHQDIGGYWVQANSQQRDGGRSSNFATTMWAVIGLGKVFDVETEKTFISLIHPEADDTDRPGIGAYLAFLLIPILVIGPVWWWREGRRWLAFRNERRKGGQAK